MAPQPPSNTALLLYVLCMYSDAMFLDPCLSPLLHTTIKRLADVSNQREDLLGLTLESKQMRTCTYHTVAIWTFPFHQNSVKKVMIFKT